MLKNAGDRRREGPRQLICGVAAERVACARPAGEVEVTARALLSGLGLCEEARPQPQRRRHLLDGELGEHGVVGRAQALTRRDVEFEQPRTGLGVDRGELHAECVERRKQRLHEPLEARDLVQAVAEPA